MHLLSIQALLAALVVHKANAAEMKPRTAVSTPPSRSPQPNAATSFVLARLANSSCDLNVLGGHPVGARPYDNGSNTL